MRKAMVLLGGATSNGGTNMFARIRKWKAARKAINEDQAFNRGFLWVMFEFHLNTTSIENIENMSYTRDLGSFEKGVQKAINLIERSKNVCTRESVQE